MYFAHISLILSSPCVPVLKSSIAQEGTVPISFNVLIFPSNSKNTLRRWVDKSLIDPSSLLRLLHNFCFSAVLFWSKMFQRGRPINSISFYHPRQEMGSPSPIHVPVPALGVGLLLSAAGHVKGVVHLWLKNG